MEIEKAVVSDLDEILRLQYIAYQSEAELLNDYTIPPLTETIDGLIQEYNNGVVLKAVGKDGGIIGSVRGYLRDNTLYIGKLMVHLMQQNKGIGKALLQQMENLFPASRYELFTSSKSLKNLQLYQKAGYVPFKTEQVGDSLCFVYLEKLAQKNKPCI
jgi:Acetyltransferases